MEILEILFSLPDSKTTKGKFAISLIAIALISLVVFLACEKFKLVN